MATSGDTPHSLNLALQGGGAHGAFTWGVLDALLEDGRLGFDGITGTSAGAMNAVLLASGWRAGLDTGSDPRECARAALAAFWEDVGRRPTVFSLSPFPGLALSDWPLGNPMLQWLDVLSRVWSPYQLNPFDYNPLRSILARHVDFDALRAGCPFRLFIAATNVRSGRVRIFREHELRCDMVLASACLPFAFQAVEVRDDHGSEHFWDGGYTGNPALWPLFYATTAQDLLLVQINPLQRDDLPDTAQEIIERSSEIGFNASLLHELRAIDFVQRLLAEHKLDPAHYRRVRLHMIGGDGRLGRYRASSKYDTRPAFLRELFALGREAAVEWLELKMDYVGRAGTVRIAETFL